MNDFYMFYGCASSPISFHASRADNNINNRQNVRRDFIIAFIKRKRFLNTANSTHAIIYHKKSDLNVVRCESFFTPSGIIPISLLRK